jgi:hypothetical protein
MTRHLGPLAAVGILAFLLTSAASGGDEMVANPYYKFWASTKPGAKAVHLEKTKLSGPEGKLIPDGVDEKRITYKLLEVRKDRAIVEMVVTEQDFLGQVQAAPTRYIYPAKISKSRLEHILLTANKRGEDTIKAAGQEMACRTVAGTVKGPNGEQVEYKLWLSDDVPGSIVKQVRTARQKGDVIAVTTITLQSYKQPE